MKLLTLAARNLRRQPRRTLLTSGAVLVGLWALVAQRGLMNGSQAVSVAATVDGRLGAVQVHRTGFQAQVLASPLSLLMEDTPKLRATLAGLPHVTHVAARLESGALVSSEDGDAQGLSEPVLALGLEAAHEPLVTPERPGAEHFAALEGAGAWLDAELAGRVEGAPSLALLANDVDGLLNGVPLKVSGTVAPPAPGALRQVTVPLATLQALVRVEGRVSELALAVAPLERADEVARQARAALGPGYEVHTWRALAPLVVDHAATQDLAFKVSFTILLALVAMGLVNAMLMTVLERTREVGTMLALGLRRSQVLALFAWEGALTGLLGGVLGVASGALTVVIAAKVGIPLHATGADVPSVVRPFVALRFCLLAALAAPLGCALVSLWPARKAAGLSPIDALANRFSGAQRRVRAHPPRVLH